MPTNKNRRQLVLSDAENDELQRQADKYTGGNISARIRQLLYDAAPKRAQRAMKRESLKWGGERK